MHKATYYIFFLFFLVAFSFFIYGTVGAGIDKMLKIDSNDPIKILMACAQEIQSALAGILDTFPNKGITGIINQAIAFFETQIQPRKSIFWIELEKEKIELQADALRILSELGINL